VLEQARAIYPGGNARRTPTAYRCMFKEGTQSFGAGGHRHAAPSLFSVGSQKRIHIFQGNIVEGTILLAKPAQELLYVPVLIPDGGWRQTALVSPICGKISNPVRKGHDLGFWHFQTS